MKTKRGFPGDHIPVTSLSDLGISRQPVLRSECLLDPQGPNGATTVGTCVASPAMGDSSAPRLPGLHIGS